jgi:uncharacterized membrane protein
VTSLRSADRYGLAIAIVAAVGVAISAYLLIVHVAGGVPVCGPGGGCEAVQTSPYSELFGVPVAAFGVVFSTVVLLAGIVWLRRRDRRALYVAYALGLLGTLMEAYFVYLQLAVIKATCPWCLGYGVTVVLGLVLAGLAVRRAPSA